MDIFPGWVGWLVAGVLGVILLGVITSDWWRSRRKDDPDDKNDGL